jgi:UrcA family protein
MKKTSTRFVPALATLLLFGVATSALAAPHRDPEVVTKVVRFKDLDISTATGAQALYERIGSAARAVCRDELYRLVKECRARAIDKAIRDVGSSLLLSIHRSMTGRDEEVVVR